MAFRQGRRDERHLRAASLGHEAPTAVDDQPQPVHLEAAVPQRRLLDLVSGTRLDRVHMERGNGGLPSGCCSQTSTSRNKVGQGHGGKTNRLAQVDGLHTILMVRQGLLIFLLRACGQVFDGWPSNYVRWRSRFGPSMSLQTLYTIFSAGRSLTAVRQRMSVDGLVLVRPRSLYSPYQVPGVYLVLVFVTGGS